ncbi:MAG: hypothetical protein OEY66_07200 [Gammaproteobacteria bacterium]|nr:hypothetical protein [Gammaproteobacteria bacterium]
MDMITLLNDPNSEKILQLEIDGTHYLSDTAYYSEPTDTPANQPYAPVIAQGGIPSYRRRIQELWGGRSLASWGEVSLASEIVNGVDFSTTSIRGKLVEGFVTGKRNLVALADRLQIIKGVIGSKSVNADGGISFDVIDDQSKFQATEFPPNRYDSATEVAGFPVANHGLSKPVCLGRCKNVPATLVDAGTWTYQVNDPATGSINAISAVYDNGVVVSTSSIDLVNGKFTLTSAPVGIVTADVDGVKDGATWLSTTTLIVDWLARNYGGVAGADVDISGLPSGVVGIFLNSSTTLDTVITSLLQGCLGWWQFSSTGQLRVRQISAPVSGGKIFNEKKQLSELVFTEDDELYWSVPLLYQRNWQRLEPASSVAANQATWLRSEGYESRTEDAAILAAYDYASTASRLETYFDVKADAETVGTLALAMFGVPRYRTVVDLPLTAPLTQLGDSIEFQDAGIFDGDYLAIGLTDEWDEELPVVKAEVWG